MSLLNIRDALRVPSASIRGREEMESKELRQYRSRLFTGEHSRTAATILGAHDDNLDDADTSVPQRQAHEEGHLMANLRDKNFFPEQGVTYPKTDDGKGKNSGKWYKRPLGLITACAVAIVLAVLLKYKLKTK